MTPADLDLRVRLEQDAALGRGRLPRPAVLTKSGLDGCFHAAPFVTSDIVASAACVALAWMALRPAEPWLPWSLPSALILFITPFTLCVFGFAGHYVRRVPFWDELRHVVACSVMVAVALGFLEYCLHRQDSRMVLGLACLTFPIIIMSLRGLARICLAATGRWKIAVVIVGRGAAAANAASALRCEPRLGYEVSGIVAPPPCGTKMDDATWRALLEKHRAKLVLLALDPADSTAGLTASLVRARVPFAVIPWLDGLPVLGFERTSFFSHDTVMLTYKNNLASPLARLFKIVFDLTVASVCLLLAAPVLLLIALFVRLDGGPALYAHTRVGANGRPFRCLKFRSMVPDADAVLRRVLESDADAAAEWAETRKLRRDPRITTIGRLLRATSLDELPQLLNVVRLEMSLVGPRPIVEAEVPRYGEDISFYYETRPGLTGLWQVSGRSETSYGQRVRLDTWYVKNWKIWHDVAILAKTVPAVLKRQGAV